jgi:hypothetical protein
VAEVRTGPVQGQAGISYVISLQSDGSFAVELRRPGGGERISGFAGEAEAAAWIAKQQAGKPQARAHHQRFTRTADEREDRTPPSNLRR